MALGANISVTADTGVSDGTITLTVFGVPHGYVLSFLWNDGATTQNRTSLAAGNYFVEIKATAGDAPTLYASYYITIPTEYVNFLSHLRCCFSSKAFAITQAEEEGLFQCADQKQEALILWDIVEQLRCATFNNSEQYLTNDQMQALIGKASLICGCPPIQILPPKL